MCDHSLFGAHLRNNSLSQKTKREILFDGRMLAAIACLFVNDHVYSYDLLSSWVIITHIRRKERERERERERKREKKVARHEWLSIAYKIQDEIITQGNARMKSYYLQGNASSTVECLQRKSNTHRQQIEQCAHIQIHPGLGRRRVCKYYSK